jgi:hypothetical protein
MSHKDVEKRVAVTINGKAASVDPGEITFEQFLLELELDPKTKRVELLDNKGAVTHTFAAGEEFVIREGSVFRTV